jgi:hypothetical protein
MPPRSRAVRALPLDPTARSDRPGRDWALESCRVVQRRRVYPAGT